MYTYRVTKGGKLRDKVQRRYMLHCRMLKTAVATIATAILPAVLLQLLQEIQVKSKAG